MCAGAARSGSSRGEHEDVHEGVLPEGVQDRGQRHGEGVGGPDDDGRGGRLVRLDFD